MKALKIVIAAVALFTASVSVAAPGPQFGHWTVLEGGSGIANGEIQDDGSWFSVMISAKTLRPTIHWDETPATNSTGELSSNEDVLSINGKSVKVVITYYNDDSLMIAPKTKAGIDWFNAQLWTKSKVYFKFRGGNTFWISAKGVQAAAKYADSINSDVAI